MPIDYDAYVCEYPGCAIVVVWNNGDSRDYHEIASETAAGNTGWRDAVEKSITQPGEELDDLPVDAPESVFEMLDNGWSVVPVTL